MKIILPAAFALLFFTVCREKPLALTEPILLTFYSTTSSTFCEPDSFTLSGDNRGSLLLLTSRKALYSLKTKDSIHYFRGNYRLTENGIFCNFDAQYDHARTKAPKSRKLKTRPLSAMKPIRTWNLNISKTGCAVYIYFSEKGNLETSGEDSVKLLYREATAEKAMEYLTRINGIDALVDFHLEVPPAIKKANVVGDEITGPIENYYVTQNNKGKVKRTEDDTTVRLSFTYKKVPAGEDGRPYLLINIPKARTSMLTGDVSGDGQPDLVVQPSLSQGGNYQWKEMFVFVKNGKGYGLRANASNFDLAQYKKNSHSGCFYADEIRDGKIVGTSICYLDDDAQCCPSVKIPTGVFLKDSQIKSSVLR
jgi:hypothetical protein